MSVSAASPVIHPLPVLQACRYECCRSAPADVSLHDGHDQPGRLPEADAVTPAPYASLKDPFVATGMHCPSGEPLEELVAGRRRLGWVPDFDATEAAVAAALECGACAGRLCYLALAPAPGARASAWAICVTCRHWIQL